MVGDSVAIDVPAELAAEEASRAVEACLVALGPDRCTRVDAAEARPDFRATIRSGAGDELVIVLRRSADDAPVAERRIVFLPTDPAAYRWQSAGVVTASMVLGEAAASAPVPEPPPTSEPAAPSPPSSKVGTSTPKPTPLVRLVALDLAGLAGSGVSGGSARAGGLARGELRFASPLFVLADLRVAGSEDAWGVASSRALWVSGGLGVGTGFELAPGGVGFEVHAQATVESFSLRAEDELGSEERSRVRWGGRLGGVAVVPLTRALGLVAGGDVGVAAPTFTIEVGGGGAGRLGTFAATGFFGVRLAWDRSAE